jgi:hypothetical protein
MTLQPVVTEREVLWKRIKLLFLKYKLFTNSLAFYRMLKNTCPERFNKYRIRLLSVYIRATGNLSEDGCLLGSCAL